MNILKKNRDEFNKLNTLLEDSSVLLEFIENGETEFQEELKEKVGNLENEVESFKIKLLLDEKYDSCNAILTINAGAGGTEACDWAEMLYRMYDRWAAIHGFSVSILDSLAGD